MNEAATKDSAFPDDIPGTYIGTKLVKASPMDKFQWLEKNGTDTTNLDQPNLPGYLVIHPDGYESWCPKEVFEKYYRLLTYEEIKLVCN